MTPNPAPRGRDVARSGAFTPDLADAFVTLIEQTGNYRAAARTLGHRHLFNNRMYRDPAFRHRCEAAAVAADARLREAESRFLPPVETKSMPPEESGPAQPEQIIRRTSNGRLQISHVREGCLTAENEADFLARLRATGNFDASARAVGFQPSSFYRRLGEWPAFARDCNEARDAAEVMLGYRLVAHAHALLLKPGEAGACDDVPFDAEAAMRIIAFLDRRKAGLTASRRKGPPDRSFEEVIDFVLTKIEAIDAHEAKYGKPPDEDGCEGDAAPGPSSRT